jgi:hypothetical protein
MAGNVFLNGAKPSKYEPNALVLSQANPELKLVEKSDGTYLQITSSEAWTGQQRQLVTTDLLGRAKTPDLRYEQPDGSPYRIDTDYLGRKRNPADPFPGPVEPVDDGQPSLKVWPLDTPK